MIIPKPKNIQANEFPWWVYKPEGKPLLIESDFPSTIGYKWGVFKDGAGSVVQNTNHFFGGSSSAEMITDGGGNANAEIKINLPMEKGLIAFEQKWGKETALFGNTVFDMGIEPRRGGSTGFYQSRMRFTISDDEWTYESDVDVYNSFDDPLIISEPDFDNAPQGSGDRWGWARLVIDSLKNEYVSFEALGGDGIQYRDMRGIPLVNRGSSSFDNLLVFTLVKVTPLGVEHFMTTDWCISKL